MSRHMSAPIGISAGAGCLRREYFWQDEAWIGAGGSVAPGCERAIRWGLLALSLLSWEPVCGAPCCAVGP